MKSVVSGPGTVSARAVWVEDRSEVFVLRDRAIQFLSVLRSTLCRKKCQVPQHREGHSQKALDLLELRQLRCIPSAADGLDQENAGIHASPFNVDVIALICQKHGLRSNHL
jgi:hypothetical protein